MIDPLSIGLGLAIAFPIAMKLERRLSNERRRRYRESENAACLANLPLEGLAAAAGQEHAANNPCPAQIGKQVST